MQCVTVIIQLVSRDHVCRFENGSVTPLSEGKMVLNEYIVPRQCLEQIVEYAKTGQISIDPTNVWDLYLACDYCCINEITEKCQKYFVQNMNINNLENLIRMACTTSNCTTLLD